MSQSAPVARVSDSVRADSPVEGERGSEIEAALPAAIESYPYGRPHHPSRTSETLTPMDPDWSSPFGADTYWIASKRMLHSRRHEFAVVIILINFYQHIIPRLDTESSHSVVHSSSSSLSRLNSTPGSPSQSPDGFAIPRHYVHHCVGLTPNRNLHRHSMACQEVGAIERAYSHAPAAGLCIRHA